MISSVTVFLRRLFQVASFFFVLSYVQAGLLYLRICLLVATTCLALWAWFILNVALDTFLWNLLQAIVNVVMLGLLLYQRLPIKFDALSEDVYAKTFSRVCLDWWCSTFPIPGRRTMRK